MSDSVFWTLFVVGTVLAFGGYIIWALGKPDKPDTPSERFAFGCGWFVAGNLVLGVALVVWLYLHVRLVVA